jgi:hypothetical protein
MRGEEAPDRGPATGTMEGREQPDLISLAMPSDARFAGVARMLVGGLATRLDCSYEVLDDLQLAVDSVLDERRCLADAEVNIEVAVRATAIELTIGPVRPEILDRGVEPPRHEEIPLAVLLETVVDDADVLELAGVHRLRLQKSVPLPPL